MSPTSPISSPALMKSPKIDADSLTNGHDNQLNGMYIPKLPLFTRNIHKDVKNTNEHNNGTITKKRNDDVISSSAEIHRGDIQYSSEIGNRIIPSSPEYQDEKGKTSTATRSVVKEKKNIFDKRPSKDFDVEYKLQSYQLEVYENSVQELKQLCKDRRFH